MCARTRVRHKVGTIERKPLGKPYLIVCEGRGDAEFIAALLAAKGLNNFDVDYAIILDDEGNTGGGNCRFGDLLRGLRTGIWESCATDARNYRSL